MRIITVHFNQMGKKRNRHPQSEFTPNSIKVPRQKEIVTNYKTQHPSWQISRVDEDGKWGWNSIGVDEFKSEILAKIKNFETITWAEILGDKNHEVSISEISKDAKKRLAQLKLEDIESLVSLRLTGRKRIWGIRDVSVFKILWWDPEHEVYPSTLRGT